MQEDNKHKEYVLSFDCVVTLIIMMPFKTFLSFEMKVAERLSKEQKISHVYSSDLKRAFETAQIIAAKCGKLEVDI